MGHFVKFQADGEVICLSDWALFLSLPCTKMYQMSWFKTNVQQRLRPLRSNWDKGGNVAHKFVTVLTLRCKRPYWMKAKVKGEDVWIGIRSCKMFKKKQLERTIRFSLSVSKSTVDTVVRLQYVLKPFLHFYTTKVTRTLLIKDCSPSM